MVGMKIQLGYTPDADDAYMLYGLLQGKVSTGDWDWEPVEANLQTLNDRASRGRLDATMISAAAYPLVQDRYRLLPAGASFGLGVGPVIVSRDEIKPTKLPQARIAVPGATTTAFTMLQLFAPTLPTRVLPLDKLLPSVQSGLVDCALVIHEEFITYPKLGLHVVLDLGAWWAHTHDKAPMPVTVCVVKRDLPETLQRELADALKQSIAHARSRHGQAVAFAAKYARGAEPADVERFIRQYVNDLSLDMGSTGKDALEMFFRQAAQAGLLPAVDGIDFV
ncbi:MAG: hypothetical protein JXA11_16570 [Phycisphaerae bacterium]|nr:hypothetical protein [Phycisphaerae bacterium]